MCKRFDFFREHNIYFLDYMQSFNPYCRSLVLEEHRVGEELQSDGKTRVLVPVYHRSRMIFVWCSKRKIVENGRG